MRSSCKCPWNIRPRGRGPRPALAATLARQDRAEEPPALADEPLSRLCRHRQLSGANFLADARSVAAVVEETASRGLLLLDDGSSPQSLTAKIAAAASAPHLVADVNIDADRNIAGLEKAQLRLESMGPRESLAVASPQACPKLWTASPISPAASRSGASRLLRSARRLPGWCGPPRASGQPLISPRPFF